MNIQLSRKKLYITILTVAFLIFFHGFGKPHVLPWQGSLALKYPAELEARDGRYIVVDDETSRIIFVDSHGRVSKIIAVSELKPSFDVIEGIASDNKYLYLLGYDVKEGGLQITKEHIEKYSLRGRHIKTLYEQIPEQEAVRIPCALSDVKISDGKLYFTEISDDRKTVAAYKISVCENGQNLPERICAFDSPDDIICGEYDIKSNTLIVTNQFNEVWLKTWNDDKAVQSKDENSSFACYSRYMAKALKAYRKAAVSAEDADEELTPYNLWCRTEQNSDGSSGKIYLLRYRHNSISCYDMAKETITVYDKPPVSFAVWLNGFGYWVSILLLALALLKLLCAQLKKGLTNGMKYTAAIIAVSAIIIGFYSNALYTQLLEQYRMRITVLCHSVLNYAEKNAGEFIYNPDRANVQSYCRGKLQRDSVSAVAREIATLAGQAGEKDSFFVEAHIFGENGQLYALADSMRFLPAGTLVSKEQTNYYLSNSIDNRVARYHKSRDAGWLEEEDDIGKYLLRCMTERDMHGNVSLMVLSGCCIDNLRTRAVGKTVETFINLLACLIVLFVSVTVFGRIKEKIRLYIANRNNRDNDQAAMAIVALYAFWTFLAYSIDVVLMVLVSAQLCGENAAKLALPSLCAGIGAIVGKVALMGLHRTFKNKTVVTAATGLMALSYAACAVAVELNSILIFSAAQFVKQLCGQGIIVTMVYKMPFSCAREDLKREATSFFFTAKNAGTILSLLIGGFAASLLDYRAMYLIAAAIGAALCLLFGITYIDCETKENGASSASLAKVFKVCFKEDMFVFLALILLPKAAAISYSEKIFPVFATLSNIPLLIVSNLTVFVKTFNYLVVGKLSKNETLLSITPVKIVADFNILIGFLYAGIWLNGAVFWAIVILFLIDAVAEVGTGFGSFYITDIGEKYAIPRSDIMDLHSIIYGAGVFISATLLLLLGFGYQNACGIIGAGYIICALAFKALSGKMESGS